MSIKEQKALEALRRIHELLANNHSEIDHFSNVKDFKSTAILSTNLLEEILNVSLPVDEQLEESLKRLEGKMFGVDYMGSEPLRRNKK